MFKDEIKEIVLPQFKIPKLKGHTKIELTDVHTGKKEVIEHDNAFTTGLESYFRALGVANNLPFRSSYSYNRKLWETVLGGIYLFDNALPDSAKYMPAGMSMTANGSFGIANASTPTELGTYNEIESHSDENGITMVFDWNTSQGNGTIAAVSLGTMDGGYIGYGNATSKTSAATRINTHRTQEMTLLQTNARSWDYSVFHPIIYNNRIYITERWNYYSGTTTVKVKYCTFPLTKVDVLGKIMSNVYSDAWDNEITFTLPEALPSACFTADFSNVYPSCIVLSPIESIASGTTAKFYLLDVADGTVKTLSIPNNLGVSIYANNGIFISLLDDTYALVLTGSGTGDIYKMNYISGTSAGIATKNGFAFGISHTYDARAGRITDDLFNFYTSGYYIYDSVKNEFLPTNGEFVEMPSGATASNIYDDTLDAMIYCYSRYNSSFYTQVSAHKNPLRLMTINNLDTPVIKTASKTMKVTYTITRAS